MIRSALPLLLLLFCLGGSGTGFAQTPAAPQTPAWTGQGQDPVVGRRGMLVAADPIAVKEGLKVLQEGGNAVDAAVTMGLTMAVTLPRAGNLGGGGFMMVALKDGQILAIDYREKAPLAATPAMFLNEAGELDNQKSRFSALSAGVPGTVAGLHLALKKFGSISWERALEPAIRYAEQGFEVSPALARDLAQNKDMLAKWPSTKRIFFDGKEPLQAGDMLEQPDLAKSLKLLAKEGPKAFYRGEIAQKIVAQMQKSGGLINKEDLRLYYPALRTPVRGKYRDYEIISMGPPSSGGVHVIQLLHLLEPLHLKRLGHNSSQSIHVMAEAMKLAYADRSRYLGDEDFVKVPVDKLTSMTYANQQRSRIKLKQATPSEQVHPTHIKGYESFNTTHVSVVDQWGNAVSNTTTLNFSFGSGLVVEGAGFFLNNEMDDFAAKPGAANAYGLIGGEANGIEPGKRMLSSMTPLIVRQQGKVRLVTGSPGGSQIITTVLQVTLNVLEHGMNIQEAVSAPRIHHQWMPDELRLEPGISDGVQEQLTALGHQVVPLESMGAAMSIYVDPAKGLLYGAADPRRDGLALGF